MTHVRTYHPIALYDAKKSVAESAADNLVILGWKGNEKQGRVGHLARCFPCPKWFPELMGDDKEFLDILVDAVEARQKLTAHKYVTEMLDRGEKCLEIPAYLLEPRQILADFQEEQENGDGRGKKLSSLEIKVWFQEKLAETVQMQIANAKGWLEDGFQMSPEQLKSCEQTSNLYRSLMEKLASPAPKIEVRNAIQLQRAIGWLGSEGEKDMIAIRLGRKLESIINPPKEKEVFLDDIG